MTDEQIIDPAPIDPPGPPVLTDDAGTPITDDTGGGITIE